MPNLRLVTLAASAHAALMDTPDGYDRWSAECKARFQELKQEYDRRMAAEAEHAAAVDEAETADRDLADARRPQDADAAEIAAIDAWIAQMPAAAEAEETRIEDELQRAYDDWVRATNPNEAQKRESWANVRRQRRRRLDDFKRAQNRLKTEKQNRRRELGDAMRAREPGIAQAEADLAAANTRVDEIERRLEDMRDEETMMQDYYALIRRCGPQDPKPGDPAIPITPRFASRPVPRTFRPKDIPAYLGFLPHFGFVDERVEQAPERDPVRQRVGVGDDILEPSGDAPLREQLRRPRSVPIAKGPVWHEGCVQFIWVEGTDPHLAGPAVSNPITRSVEDAAAVVNDIWRKCCVRFRFSLKIVSIAQLGALANAPDGIYLDRGTVTCAPRAALNEAGFGETVRRLRDDPNCAAFLVVDEVRGAAGFGERGGKIGVVTIHGPNLPEEDLADADRSGTTTAHELGHALGGIKHVEGEGANRVAHAHGELMWGEGCVDHPQPQQRRYETVTAADCLKMRAATNPTTEACTETEPV